LIDFKRSFCARLCESACVKTPNVGLRDLNVHDSVQNASIATHVLYPTSAPDALVPVGPFHARLAQDAEVLGEALPLVLVSHGNGSMPWLHRDLAAHLVRAGFVVALLTHPGNNRGDNKLANTPENLVNRPRHIRLAIDALLADPEIGPRVMHTDMSLIGHSMGGYTALAVAGATPFALSITKGPKDTPRHYAPLQPFDVEHDARVGRLVLLAPATLVFMGEGALANVHGPILMRTGEHDVHTPAQHAEIVKQALPSGVHLDHKVVAGAGHFAFVSAYPVELKSPSIAPSQDPDGFDRPAYLPVLFAEIEAFLRS
jgi:pimeloyl-ACP methyl ester carboxylesterase